MLASPPAGAESVMIHGGLQFPVAFRFAPDGRLFYCELFTGRVQVFDTPTSDELTTWATLPVDTDGERGLLGMEFHPQFPDSPYVYFFHTNRTPLENRVVRLRDLNGVGVDYQVLFRLPASELHNGGRLAFGPDGRLYVTYGDQQVTSAARDANDVRGKIHRLTPLGVPAGNLFHPANPAFARGVRNAFGICFDPVVPGRAFFTENGPECDDEINALWSGADYGWGTSDPCGGDAPATTKPIARLSPTVAPTGCCVYRGGPDPGFEGALVFGTFNHGDIRCLFFDPLTGEPTEVRTLTPRGDAVLDVVQGPDGRIWYSTFDAIYRLMSVTLSAPPPGPTVPRLSAWPNPSARDVSFRITTPRDVVSLEVYDPSGRRIRELTVRDGLARWDGRDSRGARVPAGVYLARLREGNAVHHLRIVRLAR
jgi:glucose/arabinose dehydrogenase